MAHSGAQQEPDAPCPQEEISSQVPAIEEEAEEDPSDRAMKKLKPCHVRIPLEEIGFWPFWVVKLLLPIGAWRQPGSRIRAVILALSIFSEFCIRLSDDVYLFGPMALVVLVFLANSTGNLIGRSPLE